MRERYLKLFCKNGDFDLKMREFYGISHHYPLNDRPY